MRKNILTSLALAAICIMIYRHRCLNQHATPQANTKDQAE